MISTGTERSNIQLARKSLLGKARERPDHVRRILEKLRNEGFFKTFAQVRERLDEPMTLGNSSAGITLACGAGVQRFKPGDLVASNGPHAGVVCVPMHLCGHVPPTLPLEQAAFGVLGAIALQGVRLSRAALGETVLIIGLGLVGMLTAALLRAAGVQVIGTDLDLSKCQLATAHMGVKEVRQRFDPDDVLKLTGSLGADAVIITASTKSKQPIELAANAVRSRGRVVLVGSVALELDRRPFYFKEAEFVVSCSYGPGRYDPVYEEQAHDYPPAYVRWTEQRNIQAVLDLMGSGQLNVAPLITHRFPIQEAESAYELIDSGKSPHLGVILTYPEINQMSRNYSTRSSLQSKPGGTVGVGCLGAGNYARLVLLPIISSMSSFHLRLLCSAGGLSAAHTANKLGFDAVTTDEDEVFNDPQIDAVFITTRHDQHARQIVKAIQARKHVFVEKPLALTIEEVVRIEEALIEVSDPKPLLMVGFNRRFSPLAVRASQLFADVSTPLTVSVRFNAGPIAEDHWTQDDRVGGGRIIGEACHGIDLATFFTSSPPVRVFAESIGGRTAPQITDDQCFITLRHANGSVSQIAYLAGGDRAFPKERVEVFGGGRVAIIDDFRDLAVCSSGKLRHQRNRSQDKGHAAEIKRFALSLTKEESEPIPWNELRAVSMAAILAVRSIREGFPLEVP